MRRALGLDRMLLMVANQPWQKRDERTLTPAEDRFAMVEAAVDGWPGLEPCRMEIDRGGPSYTIDTVRQLQRDDPGRRAVPGGRFGRGGRPDHLAGRAPPPRPGHPGRGGPARGPDRSPLRRVGGR